MASPSAVSCPAACRTRRALARLALALAVSAPTLAQAVPSAHTFHRDHVLGTSFDLIVWSETGETARRAEASALAEIGRLASLLSVYDPASEVSRLNQAAAPVVCSSELVELLGAYDQWGARSGGAVSGQLGGAIRLWKDAEKAGHFPDEPALSAWLETSRQPAWTLNPATREVVRTPGHTIDNNSLGKGFIIGRAAEAVSQACPGLPGFLLNIGGDLRAAGSGTPEGGAWTVPVADPFSPADNAAPLTRLRVKDRAVASSGSYQRGYTIGGQRLSHIIDPRTARPAGDVVASTVVAADNVTANALATALCVLGPEAGLKLVGETAGAEALLVGSDGRQHRSPGFGALEFGADPAKPEPAKPAAASPWPKGYRMQMSFALKSFTKAKKPYTAVWIEDKDGKPVRTLAVWGNKPKYLRDLPKWWAFANADKELIGAVTRATRGPGKYTLDWDGLNDKGEAVTPGAYTVVLEVAREHGTHAVQRGAIECLAKPAKGAIAAGSEFDAGTPEFGPATPAK